MAYTDHSRPVTTPGARQTGALVLGDTVAFLTFAAIGIASHNGVARLADVSHLLVTALPFAAGWFLAAPLAGAFRRDVMTRPGAMLARTALGWLLGCGIGLGLRALLLQTGIPLSFAIVTFLTTLLILGLWRGGYAWFNQRTAHVADAGGA